MTVTERACSTMKITRGDSVHIPNWTQDATSNSSPDEEELEPLTNDTSLNEDNEKPEIFNDEDGKLDKLCEDYSSIFPKKLPKQAAKLPAMKLKVIAERPKYRKPRRLSYEQRKSLAQEVQKLLDAGIIEPSTAEIASNVLLVKKPDGTWRFTTDFREINRCLKQLANPLPNAKDLIHSLRGKKYFAQLDLRHGYFQCALDKRSRDLTSFTTPMGLHRYTRVPQGLPASPGWFQSRVNEVLNGLIGVIAVAYLDGLVVFGDSIKELHDNLERVFKRFAHFGLSLKASKCKIGATTIDFLGHRVSGDNVEILPERVASITSINPPTDVRGLRSFLGATNFARGFLPDYGRLTRPLLELLKKGKKFEWTKTCQTHFDRIKTLMTTAPILTHFDPSKRVVLATDASATGMGAVLLVEKGGKLQPVEYLSKAFSPRESRWSTYEQEAFAFVHAMKKWEHYLIGLPKFEVWTDHRNLSFLEKSASAKVTRWRLSVQEFNFVVRHISGRDNGLADALSRKHVSPRHKSAAVNIPYDR